MDLRLSSISRHLVATFGLALSGLALLGLAATLYALFERRVEDAGRQLYAHLEDAAGGFDQHLVNVEDLGQSLKLALKRSSCEADQGSDFHANIGNNDLKSTRNFDQYEITRISALRDSSNADGKRYVELADRVLESFGPPALSRADSVWFVSKSLDLISMQLSGDSGAGDDFLSSQYRTSRWLSYGAVDANLERKARWTSLTYNEFLHRWMLSVVIPIDVDGVWIGNVGANVFISTLRNLAFANQGDDESSFVYDDSGRVIVDEDIPTSGEGYQPYSASIMYEVEDVARQLGDRNYGVVNFRGERRIASQAVLHKLNWTAIRLAPMPSYFAEGEIWPFATIFIVLLLVTLAMTIALVERRIILPLRRLKDEVSAYRIDGAVSPQKKSVGRYELGRLGSEIDGLIEQVQISERRHQQIGAATYRQLLVLREVADRRRTYLAQFSHEFRTQLNSIIGFGQMLELQGSLETNGEYLKAIVSSAERAAISLDVALGATSAGEDAKGETISPVNLQTLLCEAIDQVKAILRKNVVIEARARPDDLEIACRPKALRRVISIILSHAMARTHSGGTIVIEVDGDDGDVVITCSDEAGFVHPAEVGRLMSMPSDHSDTIETNVYLSDRMDQEMPVAREIVVALGGVFDIVNLKNGLEFRVVMPKESQQDDGRLAEYGSPE